MKLLIRREQAEKGLLRKKIRFLLYAKVELTEQENDLIKKYQVEKEPLISKSITFLGQTVEVHIRVEDLIRGRAWNCENVLTIIHREEQIRAACDNFKTILGLMASFGGEEVIEL